MYYRPNKVMSKINQLEQHIANQNMNMPEYYRLVKVLYNDEIRNPKRYGKILQKQVKDPLSNLVVILYYRWIPSGEEHFLEIHEIKRIRA